FCAEFIHECVTDHGGTAIDSGRQNALCGFDSIVDAVCCVFEIQEILDEVNAGAQTDRRMLARFGIHFFDAIVDGDTHLEDGVNIATGLGALADPGGVCASENVVINTVGKADIDFAYLGKKAVKNVGQAIHAYSISRKIVPLKAYIGRTGA
ncbi:MAG: hypothetical protein ACR2PM_14335, partial [Hyphomicrobiales bacterium]